MRNFALAAVLFTFTACAARQQQAAPAAEAPKAVAPKAEAPKAEVPKAEAPKPEEPKKGGLPRLDFVSTTDTKAGGNVNETKYSEKADDAAVLDKKFENGVISYTGQLGFGKNSAWAGFGFGVNFAKDGSPVDLGKAETITFHLASPTARVLRLRITGTEKDVERAGCYPIFMQPVTPEMTEYVIPIARFAPETWCGPKARTIAQTVPQAMGVEIVDVSYLRAPSTFSAGSISVQ